MPNQIKLKQKNQFNSKNKSFIVMIYFLKILNNQINQKCMYVNSRVHDTCCMYMYYV